MKGFLWNLHTIRNILVNSNSFSQIWEIEITSFRLGTIGIIWVNLKRFNKICMYSVINIWVISTAQIKFGPIEKPHSNLGRVLQSGSNPFSTEFPIIRVQSNPSPVQCSSLQRTWRFPCSRWSGLCALRCIALKTCFLEKCGTGYQNVKRGNHEGYWVDLMQSEISIASVAFFQLLWFFYYWKNAKWHLTPFGLFWPVIFFMSIWDILRWFGQISRHWQISRRCFWTQNEKCLLETAQEFIICFAVSRSWLTWWPPWSFNNPTWHSDTRVCTIQLFCHRAFIYSDFRWQLVSLVCDGSQNCFCLITESYESIIGLQTWKLRGFRFTVSGYSSAWPNASRSLLMDWGLFLYVWNTCIWHFWKHVWEF